MFSLSLPINLLRTNQICLMAPTRSLTSGLDPYLHVHALTNSLIKSYIPIYLSQGGYFNMEVSAFDIFSIVFFILQSLELSRVLHPPLLPDKQRQNRCS